MGEGGGSVEELTADAGVASACSGKHRSVRSGEGDLRRPATKMTKMVMMQGLRRRVTRWRGRGRCGGASGLLEGGEGEAMAAVVLVGGGGRIR